MTRDLCYSDRELTQIMSLTRKIRIFFAASFYGAPKRLCKASEHSPALYESKCYMGWKKFGWPTGRSVRKATAEIHRRCPDLAAAYRKSVRDYKEARKRFKACATQKKFDFYMQGSGSKSVSYRTAVALKKRNPRYWFAKNLLRYMAHEILPRKLERERARREVLEALTKMDEKEREIFDRLRIPQEFR